LTKSIEVREEVKDLLQEKLRDPNKSRRNDDLDFVFTETPDQRNRYPQILVQLADSTKEGLSIGKPDRFERQRIQVSVMVNHKNEFDIDGDNENESAGYTRDWLAQEIDSVIIQNQSRFRDLGEDIYSVLPESHNPVSPEGVKRVNLDYILRRRTG